MVFILRVRAFSAHPVLSMDLESCIQAIHTPAGQLSSFFQSRTEGTIWVGRNLQGDVAPACHGDRMSEQSILHLRQSGNDEFQIPRAVCATAGCNVNEKKAVLSAMCRFFKGKALPALCGTELLLCHNPQGCSPPGTSSKLYLQNPKVEPCIKTNPPYGGSLLKEMGKSSIECLF